MFEYVLSMKKKLEQFIGNHNRSSSSIMSYETLDKKFLQRISGKFEQIKFFLVYFLMNLINLEKKRNSSKSSQTILIQI